MKERVLNRTPHDSYEELKSLLLNERSLIRRDITDQLIVVEHGEVWARSSRNYKQKVEFEVHPQGPTGSRIIAHTEVNTQVNAIGAVGLVVYIALGLSAAFIPPMLLGDLGRFWPSGLVLTLFGLGLFITLPLLVYLVYSTTGGRGDAFADEVLGRIS